MAYNLTFQDINETIKIVPIPPNIDSVNTLFGTNIKNAEVISSISKINIIIRISVCLVL